MNKLFFRLSLFILAASLSFVSCNKEEIEIDDSINDVSLSRKKISSDKIFDLNELNSVTEFDVSEDFDAMTFFTGAALNLAISADKGLIEMLQNKEIGTNFISISSLCKSSPNLESRLNYFIYDLLLNTDQYSNWKIRTFGKNLESNFNYLEYFDKIISRKEKSNALVLYVPFQNNNSENFGIGLDITTPNKELALIFNGKDNLLVSEDELKKSSSEVIFVSINIPSTSSERWGYILSQKAHKWYHHEKVSLHKSKYIKVVWGTKYRWYSGWREKRTNYLYSNGDSTEYSYSNYRIIAEVYHNGPDHHYFKVWDKHWSGDNWQQIW